MDGTVHIWDVETSSRLQHYPSKLSKDPIRCAVMCDSTRGFACGVRASGDDVLIASTAHLISHLDVRMDSARMQPVAEWHLPPTSTTNSGWGYGAGDPAARPGGSVSLIAGGEVVAAATTARGPVAGAGDASINSILATGHYLLAGTSAGGLWVLDRRNGQVVTSTNAHDSPVIKIMSCAADHTFITVSERSGSALWDMSGNTLTLLRLISGMPDAGGPMLSNNVFLHNFEEQGSFAYHSRLETSFSARCNTVLYAFSGHRQAVGKLFTPRGGLGLGGG